MALSKPAPSPRAIGDDAAAAGMQLVPGSLPANQIDTAINETRDYIAQGKGATAFIAPGKVVKRDDAGRAQIAEPVGPSDIATQHYVDVGDSLRVPLSMVGAPDQASGGAIPIYNSTGQLAAFGPTAAGHVANKDYVDRFARDVIEKYEALAKRLYALEHPTPNDDKG